MKCLLINLNNTYRYYTHSFNYNTYSIPMYDVCVLSANNLFVQWVKKSATTMH